MKKENKMLDARQPFMNTVRNLAPFEFPGNIYVNPVIPSRKSLTRPAAAAYSDRSDIFPIFERFVYAVSGQHMICGGRTLEVEQ